MDFAAGKYGSPDDPYFERGACAHQDGFHGDRVGILALALRRQIAARSARAPNGRTAKVGRKSHKTSLIDAAIRGSKCSRCWNICTFRRLRDWGGRASPGLTPPGYMLMPLRGTPPPRRVDRISFSLPGTELGWSGGLPRSPGRRLVGADARLPICPSAEDDPQGGSVWPLRGRFSGYHAGFVKIDLDARWSRRRRKPFRYVLDSRVFRLLCDPGQAAALANFVASLESLGLAPEGDLPDLEMAPLAILDVIGVESPQFPAIPLPKCLADLDNVDVSILLKEMIKKEFRKEPKLDPAGLKQRVDELRRAANPAAHELFDLCLTRLLAAARKRRILAITASRSHAHLAGLSSPGIVGRAG